MSKPPKRSSPARTGSRSAGKRGGHAGDREPRSVRSDHRPSNGAAEDRMASEILARLLPACGV